MTAPIAAGSTYHGSRNGEMASVVSSRLEKNENRLSADAATVTELA